MVLEVKGGKRVTMQRKGGIAMKKPKLLIFGGVFIGTLIVFFVVALRAELNSAKWFLGLLIPILVGGINAVVTWAMMRSRNP